MMTKMLFGVACATSSIFYLNDRYKDTPSPFIYDKTKKNTKCLTYLKNHRRNQCPFIYQGYTVESIRTTDTKWSDIPNWSTTFCVFRHLMRHCNVLSYQQFANNAGLVLRYPIKRWKTHQSDRKVLLFSTFMI